MTYLPIIMAILARQQEAGEPGAPGYEPFLTADAEPFLTADAEAFEVREP